MDFRETAALSFKYLLRYKRRYLFLFSALAFGFCVITVITAIKEGISENLYFSAQSHYTGDIIFLGYDTESRLSRHLDAGARNAVFETIKESKLPFRRYAERTLYNDDTVLFFNGESINLRYLNGVDWQNEKSYFDKLNYISGSNTDLDDDSIIISEQIAQNLGVKTGDSIILETLDRNRQKNTWVFVIKAIVVDNSVFGLYKAYVSRKTMNYLLSFEPDESSSIGVFLQNRQTAEKDKKLLQEILAAKTMTAPVIDTRDQFEDEKDRAETGITVFVLTIPVYLTELYQLIEALNILNYFLFLMMLIIIFASASVTYKLILYERTREIGAMRAIGFEESEVRKILLVETIFLGTFSVITGFCLSLLLSVIISQFPFTLLPGFEIVLSSGRLKLVFAPLVTLFNIVAVYIVLFAAVLIPAYRASKTPLVEMLAGAAKG